MPTTRPDRGYRLEGVVLVLIVILVGTAAGAASFTHVKDWTLANSPQGTGAWFGWANAVISELVPIAALLTIRRRKRTGGHIGYPMFLLIAAAGLSLSAQLGVAVGKVGPSGWLLSAVPALAFMALVKLVLAPVPTTGGIEPTTPVTPSDTIEQPTEDIPASPATDPAPATTPVEPEPVTTPAEPVEPVHTDPANPAPVPVASPLPEPPAHLIPVARFVVVNHEQHTGRPITVDELADRLGTAPAIAGQILNTINPPAIPATRINGNTPVLDGAR